MSQLFTDIETVKAYRYLSEAPEHLQDLFRKRFAREINEGIDPETLWNDKAALYAEFGKVVCIGMAYPSEGALRVTALIGRDERKLISDFFAKVEKVKTLVAHNGLEFDYSFLIRRAIILQIPLPAVLSTIGRKPWELEEQLKDTMKMWSSTQWKYNCSLSLLCEVLGLPNPKDAMEGGSVGELWYSMFDVPKSDLPFDKEEDVFKKIKYYCMGDTIQCANVFQRINYQPIFNEDKIIFV